MKNKAVGLANWFLTVFSGALVVVLVVVGYLYFFHKNPPLEPVLPMQMDSTVYKAGDAFEITLEACRYTNDPVTIYTSFIRRDGLIIEIPPTESSSFPEGCSVIKRTSNLPNSLPPGEYFIRLRNVYHISPWPDRTVELYSTSFNIVEE